MSETYLMHHGILGQKWGVRRYQNEDGSYTSIGRKRHAEDASDGAGSSNTKKTRNAISLKAAGNRALASVYGMNAKTYAKSNKTLSSMNKAEQNKRLAAAKKAQDEANAKRDQKKATKEAINKTYKDIQKNSTFGEKLLYNDATRQKAAKYVVNNKMTMSEAMEKAKGDAKRNTMILLGVVGAVAISKKVQADKLLKARIEAGTYIP